MQDVQPPRSRAKRWSLGIGAALLASCLLLVIGLAAFPWGLLRGPVEERLSKAIGRPVTIARLERTDSFSFHPVIDIQGVSVPQADWAGRGMLARVEHARVQFAALPLLMGDFRPETIAIEGMALALVRDAQGRENWNAQKDGDKNSTRPTVRALTISDSRVTYRDGKRNRAFDVAVIANARQGLVMAGTGHIHGEAVKINGQGAAIIGAAPDKPWPFSARIDGAAVGMTIAGTTDTPLDFGHFTADATAYGNNLALLDAIIEAGLPQTQPVKLKGHVRRTAPDWNITALSGTIGRSDIAGHAVILKRDGRTRIEGAVSSSRFDFRDLSSDEGLRLALVKRARFGDRVIPDTAIDLTSVSRTDGMLDLRVRELLWPGSSPFRSLKGVLKVERSLLTLAPITLGLTRGRLEGGIRVDQRQGGPKLNVDLSVRDARLLDFFPAAAIDGSLHGHIRLQGTGKTIRSAIGRSNGSIALVAENGVIPARTASLLGQDVGRGLTTDKNEQAILRCMIARMDVSNGVARAAPILIDTSRAQTKANGSVNLANERLSLMLSGSPKKASLLRLPGAVPVAGTIKQPDIQVPKSAKSVGSVLGMLGKAITGKQGDLAGDADCRRLSAQALR